MAAGIPEALEMSGGDRGYLNLTADNLAREHVCCAIAGRQHQQGVDRKKAFLAAGFRRGLVFRKLDVRGKVFIECAPAETAWRPVVAPGHLVIHCLWVSGRYQDRGLGRELLEHCLEAGAGDRRGVVAVSAPLPDRRPVLPRPGLRADRAHRQRLRSGLLPGPER